MTLLVADIGGTNARFALFEASGDALALAAQVTLPTQGQEGFASLAGQGLEALGAREVSAAVMAVAGPVVGGRFCRAPNIPYLLDLDALPPGLLPPRTLMVNDFTAQAHGCRLLGEERSLEILPGRMDLSLTQAVLGPGTGLGKAALVPDGRGGSVVCASEGGHALFPCDSDGEWRFRAFALQRLGEPHLRREAVVSGPGLALLHHFLTGEELPVQEAAARMTPESQVTQWFARFLGRACRDYVLETAARGGLFVSGGVAARNPLLLAHPAFREEFLTSPTMAELLAGVAVRLVTDQSVGLWGAAALARGLAAA